MNGIFIKGASLPENCLACPCNFGNRCFVHPPELDSVIADTVDELREKGGKPDWCPMVEAEIDKTEPAKDWISVKDRLPDDGVEVLVFARQGSYMNLKVDYITRDGTWFNSLRVTHWQLLPEPPKEGDKNDSEI